MFFVFDQYNAFGHFYAPFFKKKKKPFLRSGEQNGKISFLSYSKKHSNSCDRNGNDHHKTVCEASIGDFQLIQTHLSGKQAIVDNGFLLFYGINTAHRFPIQHSYFITYFKSNYRFGLGRGWC